MVPTLDEVQDLAVERVVSARNAGRRAALLTMSTGTGKAQPLDAPVLTPFGYRPMGEIVRGEQVIGSGGVAKVVTGHFPQGEKVVYRVVFSDGSRVECCGAHLWKVRCRHREARKIPEERKWVVTTTDRIRESILSRDARPRWSVPMVRPVRFLSSAQLPIDPYLLGLMLGDGCFQQRTVAFSNPERELQEAVARLLPEGMVMREIKEGIDFAIVGGRGNPLITAMRGLGLDGHKSIEKFIPHPYLVAGLQERLALLQGLLDTDSYCDGHNIEYTTSSAELAAGVRFLIQSLGGTVSTTTRIPSYVYRGERRQGALSHRMIVKLPAGISPYRLKRKADRYIPRTKYQPRRAIVSVEEIGRKECQCISVDAHDSLYVTSDFVLTHNTFTTAKFMRRGIEEWDARFLFLVDRRELMGQAAAEFRTAGLPFAVEMADHKARVTARSKARVVIGSKDTLQKKRLASWPRDLFTDIVSDEVHGGTSKTWGNVYEHFLAPFHLGLTATPFRLDEKPLYGAPDTLFGGGRLRRGMEWEGKAEIDEAIAFRYPLEVAIAHGHLANVRAVTRETHVDLKGVSVTRGGDFNEGELAARVNASLNPITDVIKEEIGLLGIGRGIGFFPDVGSASWAAEMLCQKGIRAKAVHGNSPSHPMPDGVRDGIFEDYKEGRYQVLCCCELATKGFNDPPTEAVFLARPTKSLALFNQMVGRATRKLPGKDFCYAIGFAWENAKGGLVSSIDLFREDEPDPKVREIAQRLERTMRGATIDAILEKAQRLADEEREELAKVKEELRRAKVRASLQVRPYARVEWNPFNVSAVLGVRGTFADRLVEKPSVPCGAGQRQLLMEYGIEGTEDIGPDEAAPLVEKILHRDLNGLVSPKQIAILVQGGWAPEVAATLTKGEFGAAYERIKSRWAAMRRPG